MSTILYEKGGKMMKEERKTNILADNLYRRLALVEIERRIMEISCCLLGDELYSKEDAFNGLMEVLSLVEVEQQVIMNEIKLGKKESEARV